MERLEGLDPSDRGDEAGRTARADPGDAPSDRTPHSQADPPGVRVRRMEAADVPTVVGIETDAFSSPWSAETFESLLERRGLELLVMEREGEGVIGYAVLWCILDQGELANVAVTPRLRGQGLGRYLLSRVMDVARERGIETMFLEVRASNERALALYRSFGFSDVGRRKAYYERPREDALIMAAKL